MSHSAQACHTFSIGRPKEALKETMASTSNTVSGRTFPLPTLLIWLILGTPCGHLFVPAPVAESLSWWALATTHFPSPFTGIRNPLHTGIGCLVKVRLSGPSVATFPKIRFSFKLDGLGMLDTVQQQSCILLT